MLEVYSKDSQEAYSSQDSPLLHEQQRKTPKKKKKGKKIALAVTLIFVWILGCISGFLLHQYLAKRRFYDNVMLIKSIMFEGSQISDIQSSIASLVWHDAIYQKYNPATREFVTFEGYELSLEKLYNDFYSLQRVNIIKDARDKVSDLMKKLPIPPSEYKEAYRTLCEIYFVFLSITGLAVQPSGNYAQYTYNLEQLSKQYSELWIRLDIQLQNLSPEALSELASMSAASS